MVGVDEKRLGGMWTVANSFINNDEFNENVNLYYVATSTCGTKFKRLFKMICGYIEILYILLLKKVDIVHIHMAEKGSVFRKGVIVYLSKMFNKKVVIQMHAGPILAWYDTLSNVIKKLVLTIFNKSDCMLVLGEFWKKELKQKIPEEKIKVIYNGGHITEDNLYNPDGKYITYLGLMKKEKGIFDLIDAISLIEKTLPTDIKICLCGVDEDDNVAHYIEKKELNKRFLLKGWVTEEERIKIFENTQMCVLPSYYEALSMTVIESMCYGIPMITTNITTMPEMLGGIIKLIEPGDVDGLAELILNMSMSDLERRRISEQEYEKAKKCFTVHQMILNTLAIYKKII